MNRSDIHRYMVLLLLCLLPYGLYAQQAASLAEIVGNARRQAVALYASGNYAASLPYLQKAVKQRPTKDLWLMLGHAAASSGNAVEALQAYQNAWGEVPEADSVHLLWYAQSLLGTGDMLNGKLMFSRYLRLIGKSEQANELLNANLEERFYRDSIRYTVRPILNNTSYAEYAPGFFRSGLLYISDRPRESWGRHQYTNTAGESYDFYWLDLKNELGADQAEALPVPLNTRWHEGPFTTDAGGKRILFTRSRNDGQLVLLESRLQGKRWQKPKELLRLARGSAAHPSLSPRGDTLYFISDMPGGYGGTDIYRMRRVRNGWSEPENLGPELNTSGNELFPNAQLPGKLLFASNGWFGLGGLDLYEFSLGKEQAPRNLGAPINSSADDFGLVYDHSQRWGFFSSNRAGGKGSDDIYRLDVHVIRLKGVVYDSTSQKPLEGVNLSLFDGEQELEQLQVKAGGQYQFVLYPGKNYQITLTHPDFRSATYRISTQQGLRYGVRMKNLALERKVKMYVMGSVRLSRRERLGDAQIVVIDENTSQSDTLQANGRGSFAVELDAKSRYLFIAYCDSLAAVEPFRTPETGKASLSYYLNLQPAPYTRYQIEVDLVGFQFGKACRVSLVNKLSGQEKNFLVYNGTIRWQASSLEDYELCVEQDGRYVSYYFGKGWQQNKRYESLFLKEFPKPINAGEGDKAGDVQPEANVGPTEISSEGS